MVSIDPTVLLIEVGASAIIGGLLGITAKRTAKIVALIVGIQLVVFRYLESQGIVMVDWDRLSAGVLETTTQAQQADITWLESILSTTSVGVGFLAGFMIGYYRG